MKFFEPNEKRNTVAVYVFLVALFGVLCVIAGINIGVFPRFFGFLFDVIKPIIYGFVFAFALHPLVVAMESSVFSGWKAKRAVKRSISIAVVYISIILLVVLFCVSVIPEFISNYDTFASQLTSFADGLQTRVAETINRVRGGNSVYVYYDIEPTLRKDPSSSLFAFTLGEASGRPLNTEPNTVLTQVKEFFSGIISALTGRFSLSAIFSSALTVINSAKNVVIGIIISIYFLAGGRKLSNGLSRVCRAWLPAQLYRRTLWVTEKINDIFRDYIMVRIADGFILGFLTFFVLFVARVPNRLLLSVVIGVGSFFPFIGTVVAIAFGAIVVMILDIGYLPIFLISTAVLTILDSKYIEPLLSKEGQSFSLSAIWVYAAIIVMGGFFGVTGVVFGIPAVALVYSVVKEVSEKHLKRKHLPVDTAAYFVGGAGRTVSQQRAADEAPPDMETYFAEKHEDEIEASRNIHANVSGKYAAIKKFFSRFKKKK